ncbi:MAG: hypothetical protein QGH25_04025 [Candidatus Latescibacteria bacterium]|jgi:hypothetical protein|nr:hypothetical protein [Candidatus Latescibacterota bacterium]
MEIFGKGLYLLFFILVFWFAHRTHGRNLARLLADNGHAHHRVHKVTQAHPGGGTWSKHQQWMEDAV